jgi:cell division protein FtsW (lipid II flippase)
MRVIAPGAPAPAPIAARRISARPRHAATIELLGLVVSTLMVAAGLLLTYVGHTQSLQSVRADLASGALIDLRRIHSANDLAPLLAMFGSRVERDAVAQALYRRATSHEPPLEHVGALADVTIPAADIRKDAGFVDLRARLDRRPGLDHVPVLTPVDLSTIKRSTIVRTPEEFALQIRLAALVFFAAFWGAHLVRRWQRTADDPVLLPIILMLTGIGLMSMVTLRDPLRDRVIASTFAFGVAGGVAALVALSSFDLEASRLRRAVALPLSLALVLAALLLAFGSGPGASGAKVNLFGVQPVEAIRMLAILALAAYFARRLEFLRAFSQPSTPSLPWLRYLGMPRWKDVRPVVVYMTVALIFFFLQKDLGPALVLSCVFLGLYGVARGRVALVLAGAGMLLAGFLVAHELGFPATVRQRVAIWIDPWTNGVPGGDQIAHGLWAFATGGLWGTGPGLGDPQLIPAGHTDFVLAAVGEELGFVGVLVVVALNSLLCWRCLRIAVRAPGDYTALLSIGVALGLMVQAFVIASGLVGILPLSGVVTPFLSYGRSSMLANCAAIGIVLGVARRAQAVRRHLVPPVRILAGVMSVAALAIVGRTGWIQVVRADTIATASSLGEQADGAVRFQYNPRLIAVARLIERGTIFDRNGLPLATSRPDEIQAIAGRYRAAGVQQADDCAAATSRSRCYPLGGLAFHLVGDATHQTNWAARNSSFLERDRDVHLKGFDDRAQIVDVTNPRTLKVERTIRRDYQDLLPLLRGRSRPGDAAVQALLTNDRDIRSAIDARLQVRAASALEKRIQTDGFAHGAAVVLDVDTGEVLAAVSYPWPQADDMPQRDAAMSRSPLAERLFDRPRYGLYPPGSTFKLLVAAAALRSSASTQKETFACVRLPDGRVGNYVPGSTRPIRDDPMDMTPHGKVDLHRGLVVSCNAYFAQLALRLGPQPLLDAASMFQIDVSQPQTASALRRTLAQAGYGQGQVLVSPLKMARVAAAIARQGRVPQARWTAGAAATGSAEPRLLSAADAAVLARDMRAVVVSGTGRTLASNATPIAGKTGTAEVENQRAHSWFVGFAPYEGPSKHRIAFAVIVENAGYGSRAAAPVAGDLVTAARELGLIR